MYGVVSGLYRDVVGEPPPDNRRDAVVKLCHGLLGGESQLHVLLREASDVYGLVPSTRRNGNLVYLSVPYLLMVDFADFEHSLKEGDPTAQLDSHNVASWAGAFATWYAAEIGDEVQDHDIADVEERLELLCLFRRDPEKAKQAFHFILLHELGHAVLNHQSPTPLWGMPLGKLGRVALGIGVIGLAPVWIVGGSTAVLAFLVADALAFGGMSLGELIQRRPAAQQREREADKFALDNSQAAEGGSYLFGTLAEFAKQQRNRIDLPVSRRLRNQLLFSEDGDWRIWMFSHPPLAERAANCEARQKVLV